MGTEGFGGGNPVKIPSSRLRGLRKGWKCVAVERARDPKRQFHWLTLGRYQMPNAVNGSSALTVMILLFHWVMIYLFTFDWLL